METMREGFEFKQCISILKSTGKKAGNLHELRSLIMQVSNESIFHHTYQYFLKEHILEYTNDFAHWAGESLGDDQFYGITKKIHNALQRAATVALQKSLKEGFGLTVSEAMWKGKPVIGGAVGGIPLQIVHGVTGFLVHSVEGAAFRIRQFLNNPEMAKRMGDRGKEHVREHFLIARQIRDYLSIWYALENGAEGTSVLSL